MSNPNALDPFICCPECRSPFYLERLGSVDVPGKKDSTLILCTVCNFRFRSKGQTINESLGRHKGTG